MILIWPGMDLVSASASLSVGHQYRDHHLAQESAADAAEYGFAETTMPICACDNEIGMQIVAFGQDRLADGQASTGEDPLGRLDAMPSQMPGRGLRRSRVELRWIHRHQRDRIGPFQQRQGVMQGPRRSAASIPGHHDVPADPCRHIGDRYAQGRAAAGQDHLFGTEALRIGALRDRGRPGR